MLLQMLCGDQFDVSPVNLGENLKLVRHISPEARTCVIGLLEIESEKRLGSPNSPYGLIRDHPFFNVGRKINWQEIDDGVFKSIHKRKSVRMNLMISNFSIIDLRLCGLFPIYRLIHHFPHYH
jgi:hypothetical protein